MGAEELIERHYGAVYNLAYRTMGRREDAEDIAQQTFARALPRLAHVRDAEAVRAWLCRITANLCLDELRRRHQIDEQMEPNLDGLPDSDPLASPAAVAERREVRAAVWSAALSLPHQQRLVLALREWQDLSYKQIAETLDISVTAVELILFHARQRFRRAYQAGAEPWPTNETCRWVVQRLSASIDEELRPGERARIDAHLPRCATCQFAARELRATRRLYGLMPLASAPVGAQLVALMGVPAVGIAPVVLSACSGAAGGGMLLSAGAAKIGLGAVAAMVGSVMLLIGSDSGAIGHVEAALAATPPVTRTEVAAPPLTPETAVTASAAVEVAVVVVPQEQAAESEPTKPRGVAEVAHVDPPRVAPLVPPAPVISARPPAAANPPPPVPESPLTSAGREDDAPSGNSGNVASNGNGRANLGGNGKANPGGSGNAHGSDGVSPGQNNDPEGAPPHGNAGTPPGQMDNQPPPGQTEHQTPPGQADHQPPPGQTEHETPPGQADRQTPPGRDDSRTPPGQLDRQTPPGQSDRQTPPGQTERQTPAAPSPKPPTQHPAPAPEARGAPPPGPPAASAGQAAKRNAEPAPPAQPPAAQPPPAAPKTAPAQAQPTSAQPSKPPSVPAQPASPGASNGQGGAAKSAPAGTTPAQGAGSAHPPTPASKKPDSPTPTR